MTKTDSAPVIDNLFKRYRPNKWEKFVGQEKTAESLRNSILSGKISGAYGFFGPRGCGKTSAALLMAKALNCENPPGDGNPCNQCEVCKAIDSKTQLGVKIISMANDGGVDSVREIVRKAWLKQPVKVPVIILDEAHNLTKQAFEALLDPLGEKGLKTIFILCSTKPESFPDTVMSRIQKRNFRLVGKKAMSEHVMEVVESEGLNVNEETIRSAVSAGKGSVRDTLTELEYLIETGDKNVESGHYGNRLLNSLAKPNAPRALNIISMAVEEDGIEPKDLLEQMIEDLRAIMLTLVGAPEELIGELPITNVEKFGLIIGGKHKVIELMKIFGRGLDFMVMGEDTRIRFELSMLEAISVVEEFQKGEDLDPWSE